MEVFRSQPAADTRRGTSKEHNWRKELPLPARLAMLSAWVTLLGALTLTALAWHDARREIGEEAQKRFQVRVEEIDSAVRARMQAQEQVLRGARGLFLASGRVTREEWRVYVETLQLDRIYPGILGIGFTLYMLPHQLGQHVRAVRAEGFPDYTVHPQGRRAEYTAIVYLEPFNWRNRRAFGYDMFTEPTRREAMAAARDTGNPTASGKVILVQETTEDVQAGFLMYLPIYRRGVATDTPAQRRKALLGYVYSPFRMNDLMAGILGQTLPDVRLRIYDGTTLSNSSLMYDSEAPGLPPKSRPDVRGPRQASHPPLDGTRRIEVQGRSWTLQVTALPEFSAGLSNQKPHLILQAGTFISLLMFVVVRSLATLRKRATILAEDMTAALRESREQFRAAAETAHDAIVSADAGGRITYFNGAAERVFGYDRSEAVGQPLLILMPERLQAAHRAGFCHFLATGKARLIGKTVKLEARRQDGSEFPIEISVAHWSTTEGAFFTAILRDISERVAAEAKIRQLNDELQHQVDQLAQVNRDLESFSYSVSHDLRAPLRAINGFARLLDEGYGHGLDAEGQRLLRIILDNSRKMGHLIDDLLAFARLGQTPVARASVDMARLAQEAVDEICEAGDCSNVNFAVGDLSPAQGDKALLRQVWVNLLANAAKFSLPRAEPRVEAGGYSAGGEQVYFVRDNGVGFDMSYASQLFGVFQRLHKPEQFPGTGVGLAIVHRIVTKHGGRVWAESKVDQGATFYFSLPGTAAEA